MPGTNTLAYLRQRRQWRRKKVYNNDSRWLRKIAGANSTFSNWSWRTLNCQHKFVINLLFLTIELVIQTSLFFTAQNNIKCNTYFYSDTTNKRFVFFIYKLFPPWLFYLMLHRKKESHSRVTTCKHDIFYSEYIEESLYCGHRDRNILWRDLYL